MTFSWPSWLLLAAAITLAGRARPTAHREQRRGGPQHPRLSPRALESIAAFAALMACLAVLGMGRGSVTAAGVVPAVIAVVRRAHARPSRPAAAPALPLALDLIAVALRAGQPVDAALITGGRRPATLRATCCEWAGCCDWAPIRSTRGMR